MSNEQIIKCPLCDHEFSLSKAMSKDIEKDLRIKLESEIKTKVRSELSTEADLLRTSLKDAETKLATSQQQEIALRRQQRELEERTRTLQLEVERTLDAERNTIRAKALSEAAEAHRAKDAEKDKRLADALAQAEALTRKIEQGSQQTQGEAFELKIEATLLQLYPHDLIEEVAKGVKGADIVQTVTTKTGTQCGRILWELKSTKTFSPSWIPKLKEDGRQAKADILLLVSEALPDNIKTFGEQEGVWICHPTYATALCSALRRALLMTARERFNKEGMRSKAELLYTYVTGNEFRGRVEAIVEAFRNMKEDLDSERRAIEKIWAKREKNIAQVLQHMSGMNGEMEAIAQDELKSIPALELKA